MMLKFSVTHSEGLGGGEMSGELSDPNTNMKHTMSTRFDHEVNEFSSGFIKQALLCVALLLQMK